MTPEVKPIDSEEDHEAALKGGRAVGAPSGTPRADRLGVLATLIDTPGLHHAMDAPPAPIDALKFRMEPQALSAVTWRG